MDRKPGGSDLPADRSWFVRTDRGWAEGRFTLDVLRGENVGVHKALRIAKIEGATAAGRYGAGLPRGAGDHEQGSIDERFPRRA